MSGKRVLIAGEKTLKFIVDFLKIEFIIVSASILVSIFDAEVDKINTSFLAI